MTIRRIYHPDPEIARLQRKADQEDEMFSLAMMDGDKVDAERHAAKAKEYKQQMRELL